MSLEADVEAVCDNGGTFQAKLADTLRGLLNANNDRKSEIDSLRNDHEELKKNHEAFVTSAERENDLRRNEIKSLEEKMLKENQVSPELQQLSQMMQNQFISGPHHRHCQVGRQIGYGEQCTQIRDRQLGQLCQV